MFKVGKVEIELAGDGAFRLDGGAIFGVVPRKLWAAECPPDADNRVALSCNCWLLHMSDGRRILVDAGMGRDWDEKFRNIYSLSPGDATLLENLGRLGVSPEDVDVVLLTHLHFDHCGWASCAAADGSGKGRPTFPNAEYFVHRLEWEDAHDREGRAAASYMDRLYDPLQAAGQLRLLEGSGETALGGELFAIPTGGHTRGHLAWRLDSGGHHALGLADLCPLAPHRRPRWIPAYDLYPVETLAAKRRWLSAAEEGGWALLLNHEPIHPAGRLVRRGVKDLDFEPLEA
jgi:glyoxylase-like metal-dependent hydrolase (beta-lactamase superfamily II)